MARRRLPSNLLAISADPLEPTVPNARTEATVKTKANRSEPTRDTIAGAAAAETEPTPLRPPASIAPSPAEPSATAASPLPSGRRLAPTPQAAYGPRGGRMPAPDLHYAAPVRKTLYLRSEHVHALQQVVFERLQAGWRSDVSMLVREILDNWMHTNSQQPEQN